MKKAIGIILLWVIGGTLGGVPIWLVGIIGAGIFVMCYLGVYHRYIGISAGLAFALGLGVLAFGLPSMPTVYAKAPSVISETSKTVFADYRTNKDSFKTEVAGELATDETRPETLVAKLEGLEKAKDRGQLTEEEYRALRAQILKQFSSIK